MAGSTASGGGHLNMADDLLDAAPCGFLSFADDGRISFVNSTLLQMLGYARGELLGRHLETVLTVGSRIFYQTHWFPLLRMHGSSEEIFLMLLAGDGEQIGTLVNAVRRERNGVAAYDCVLMRVRERQKFENELLRAKRAAEEASAELRAQAEELQQANARLEAQAVELELQEQQLREQTHELERSSDELRRLNAELRAQMAESDRLRTVAEEANRAKSTFLAVMSHELRTPLNAIAGYVELLAMGIHGPVTDAQLEMLDRTTRSQRHLLGLINQVLNLARIEAGHVDYDIEEVRVDELVSEVEPMIDPQMEARRIGFSSHVEPGLVALADREKARQILLNLLGNAGKFTPEGGRVRLEARAFGEPHERHLEIRVIDTGIGIPADKLNSVFEPFVQVDDARTRTTQGSGLGLAISRDLARGMKGTLSAHSTPGEGSTFTLTLPLARDGSEGA